ncbi:MAG: ROK family protein [Micropruina sp.]|uniref:ROK family protein n=1 Tax=Micropruina sp. TaxID=2737536 RepID=UPI0039E683E4
MNLTAGQLRQRASTSAVLDFAWDAGVFRADHVIAALGLTRSTALAALDTLIELGLISELPSAGPEDGYRLGRPARRFELRAEAGVIIGVDAGERYFTAIVADLTGQILARRFVDVGRCPEESGTALNELDPRRRSAAALHLIDEVLTSAGRTRADVIGVGVGVPAPVDADGVSPVHPSGFWQYMNANLQGVLTAEFPAVRVENDAALAAVAEGSIGVARGHDDFMAMLVGRRLGSGVFLDGRLVRGANGGVGELEGFMYVPGIGSTHGIGVRAEWWLRNALEQRDIPADHPWAQLSGDELTAEAALAVASLDDPVSRPLLEELGSKLGRICNVVSRFYDPGLIVVCGAMAGALADVIEIARGHVRAESELPPPEIVASQFGGDIVSLGAVSAAREAAQAIALTLFSERNQGESAEL